MFHKHIFQFYIWFILFFYFPSLFLLLLLNLNTIIIYLFLPMFYVSLHRKGNLTDISKAGSLHEFLTGLHKEFGPIASFWWGKMYTVSIASADLFEEVAHVFDRPRKWE